MCVSVCVHCVYVRVYANVWLCSPHTSQQQKASGWWVRSFPVREVPLKPFNLISNNSLCRQDLSLSNLSDELHFKGK